MNAREVLETMVRTDRGSMTVWSPAEVRNALDAHVAETVAERDAEIIAWLDKKAREYRSTGRIQHTFAGAAIDAMAAKIARGAVRANNMLGADTRAEVLRRMADAAEKGTQPRESTQPADFFQPGHTYRRNSHGRYAEFRVAHVDRAPEGDYPCAFGWSRVEGYANWHSHSDEDFDGWTEATGGDAR